MQTQVQPERANGKPGPCQLSIESTTSTEWRKDEQMKTQSTGMAVITGASSGIGAVYADRLARRGYGLLLIALDLKGMAELAKKVVSETGRNIEILAADLTDSNDLAKLERIRREDSRVSLLVNNAGTGATAPLLDSNVADMSRMIALNVGAVTRLTYAAVPGFVKHGTGTIINIASIVAIAPERLNGVYGGTKAFVLAFSQSLRNELGNTGVKVEVVLPGATATDFWKKSGKPVEQLPDEIVMSAEDMVDAALAGLDRGEFATIPALPDVGQWQSYEAARQALLPNLSRAEPAARYAVARIAG
jgi:short-subunit dehydrogenase